MSNSISLNADSSSEGGTSNNENAIYNTNTNNNLDKLSITNKKNLSFKEKFLLTFLNVKKKKKKRKSDGKGTEDDITNKTVDEYNEQDEADGDDSDENEDPNAAINNFRTLVKKVLRKKKNKNWRIFMKEYEKKINTEKSLKYKMKSIFNINSDFIIIWKSTFSAFNIIFIFIYFVRYILLNLYYKDTDEEDEVSNRNIFIYYMINIMFGFEFIISVLIIIFNGGSKFSYMKLPLKLYCLIPFPLEKKFLLYLVPKFFRIDLIHRLFTLVETFIYTHVAHYILNYYVKSFITYMVELFKVLLTFGLYAHCLCCFLCFFEGDSIKYVPSLYYSIQSFTTIGFGEQSPKTDGGLIVMIVTLYLGVSFMSVTTSNINYLYNKIQNFTRETSFNEQFEFLIFEIQRSTGRVFPNNLRNSMNTFLLYRRGMAYYEIKNNNKFLFDNCRLSVIKEIHSKLFDYLKKDFEAYFQNCEDDFVYEIFQNMRPKMFESNRTLIKYNKKVKSLYFLSDGYIFIFNKKNKPVYSIFGKNLFAEYEFITQQNCNYTVKTHPKKKAFGFELKKEDWDRISEKYSISAKNFLLTIKNRKITHDKWMDWSLSSLNKNILKSDVVYEPNLISTKIEEPKEEKDDELLFNLININNNDNKQNLSLSSKKLNKILTTLAEEKDEKYNFQSKEIFNNINDMRYELKQFEQQVIDFKKSLIDHLNIN